MDSTITDNGIKVTNRDIMDLPVGPYSDQGLLCLLKSRGAPITGTLLYKWDPAYEVTSCYDVETHSTIYKWKPHGKEDIFRK